MGEGERAKGKKEGRKGVRISQKGRRLPSPIQYSFKQSISEAEEYDSTRARRHKDTYSCRNVLYDFLLCEVGVAVRLDLMERWWRGDGGDGKMMEA